MMQFQFALLAVLLILPPESNLLDLTAFRANNGYWTTFGDSQWTVAGDSLVQAKPGYDLGAMTSVKTPNTPYKLILEFEPRGDYVGAGILFAARHQNSTAHSMMVRCDNDTLLYGYFDGDKVFVPSGTPGIPPALGKHTVTVSADPVNLRYNVTFDGKRTITNAPLEYSGGYVGLVSCGGPHAFTGFTLDTATKADLQGIEPSEVPQPFAIAAGKYNLYLLTRGTRPVQVWNDQRTKIREYGSDLSSASALHVFGEPGPREQLLIECETDLVRMNWFDGSIVARTPRPSGAVTGAPLGQYYYWFAPKEIIVQSITDGNTRAFSAPQIDKPSCIATLGDRVYIATSDMSKAKFETHIFSVGADGSPTFLKSFSSWLDPRSMAVLPDGNLVYVGGLGFYESGGAVRILGPDGSHVANASLFAFGTLSRRGAVAIGPESTIYVTDPDKDNIYVLDSSLRETDPEVVLVDTLPRIRWWGPMSEERGLMYGTTTDETKWEKARVKRFGEYWEAQFPELRPNTRYFYRFFPVMDMIPGDRQSRTFSFVSPPEQGLRQAVEVKIVTAIYLKTIADGKNHWSIPEDGVVEKVRSEFEKGRLFYWRNSRCRLHTRLMDFVVIPDTEALVSGGWVEPAQARRDLGAILEKTGKKLADYDSVISVWADPGFDPKANDEEGAVGGGGLTPYGYSTFGISGRLAWLFVHEFNHQIDAFYDRAGSVKYWLNHPDPTVHPGRYGQHFDVNAFINRTWRDDEYLTNSDFGRVFTYRDADGDGMPDSDPTLPMDESRFGSDASKPDTDADGLTDLGEFMAGTFSSSSPVNQDTDGDELLDGVDPYPLYSASPFSPMERPIQLQWANTLWPRGSYPSGRPDPHHVDNLGQLRIDWSPDGLIFRITQTKPGPMTLELDLDLNNDGWFSGNDNRSYRFITTDPLSAPKGSSIELSNDGTKFVLPMTGLAAGKKIGIRIRVEQGSVAVSPFDPWSLFEFELKESPR